MEGREIREIVSAVTQVGERLVAAVEKLGEVPEVEIEPGLPVCPHCNAYGPTVMVEETEGRGALSDLVLEFDCCECGHTFLGIPLGWKMYANRHMLREDLEARTGVENG